MSTTHQEITTAPAPDNLQVGLPRFLLYFLQLGTTGFGGPIALVSRMQRDLVEKHRWLCQEDFLDGLALAQLAPGPLAAQLAMYLGFVRSGVLGATLVAAAFILPSFLMVLILSFLYVRYGGLAWMLAAFYGIGPAVIALIAKSALRLVNTVIGKDAMLWFIFLVLALSTALTEREVAWLFIAAGFGYMIWKVPIQSGGTAASIFFSLPPIWGTPFAQLFFHFSKASLFVFGSGLAIVPFLHGGVVVQQHWLTERQFVDAVAVGMITPGPVVITVAFIGYLVDGLPGAIAAALGVFLPIYMVVVGIGPFYKRFSSSNRVRAFVQGLTAAATGAIGGAVVVLARRSIHDFPTYHSDWSREFFAIAEVETAGAAAHWRCSSGWVDSLPRISTRRNAPLGHKARSSR